MNRVKCFAAAALFVLLTAVKLLVPAVGEELHREANHLIEHNTDYTVLEERLWKLLIVPKTDMEVSAAKKNVPPPSRRDYTPVTVERLRQRFPVVEQPADKALVAQIEMEQTKKPEEEELPEARPETVQAFLETQAAYTDYALPENVSYDFAALPFSFCQPVAGGCSSGFGYRLHPLKNEVKFHYGTDIAAWTGEEICAFADGVIVVSGECDSYGKYVIIDHVEGWQTLYAHCSELCVQSGETVKKGDLIARVGASGQATGPHLHFELTHNAVYVNPEYYINGI